MTPEMGSQADKKVDFVGSSISLGRDAGRWWRPPAFSPLRRRPDVVDPEAVWVTRLGTSLRDDDALAVAGDCGGVGNAVLPIERPATLRCQASAGAGNPGREDCRRSDPPENRPDR